MVWWTAHCQLILASYVVLSFTICIISNAIRKYFSRESTEMLVHAFITSRLDYCNSLLYGLPNYQLNKLQRVLNASARLVCNAPRFCQIPPLLRGLHCLPVKARIKFKILLITFKAIHSLAPKYLCDLLTSKSSLYNLRSSDSIIRSMPAARSKTLGDRAFMVAAPTIWNSLPKEFLMWAVLRCILRLIFLELYIGEQFYFQFLLACIHILFIVIFFNCIIFYLFLVK